MQAEKKYKLPKLLAEQWVEKLMSGNYTQAVKILYTPQLMELGKPLGAEAYCAMGLVGICLGVPNTYMYKRQYLSIKTVKDNFGIDIPEEIMRVSAAITELNDNMGYTFPQIANWIKENCEFI